MSDVPVWSAPAQVPPPPRGSPNVAAIAVLALLAGALGGGAAGGYVASIRQTPAAEASPAATGGTSGGPIPSAPPVSVSTGGPGDVVGVANELLPTVVTVINRLPNC